MQALSCRTGEWEFRLTNNCFVFVFVRLIGTTTAAVNAATDPRRHEVGAVSVTHETSIGRGHEEHIDGIDSSNTMDWSDGLFVDDGDDEETERLALQLRSSVPASNDCFDVSDDRFSGTVEDDLRSEWNRAFAVSGGHGHEDVGAGFSRSDFTDGWFHRLYRRHSESTDGDARYYHTSVHLLEMLQYWNLTRTSTERLRRWIRRHPAEDAIIRLSVFFHDAVYNPRSSTNEIDSARLFLEFVSELQARRAADKDLPAVSSWVASQVVAYILATQKHQLLRGSSNALQRQGERRLRGGTLTDSTPAVTTASPYFGQALFLDIDMCVLGKEPSRAYPEYAACIRKEYGHVTNYSQGRSSVLKTFLKTNDIFHTPYFRIAFESRSRRNLEAEIERLEGELNGGGGG